MNIIYKIIFPRPSAGPVVARGARGLARAERERAPAAVAGHAPAPRAPAPAHWGQGLLC